MRPVLAFGSTVIVTLVLAACSNPAPLTPTPTAVPTASPSVEASPSPEVNQAEYRATVEEFPYETAPGFSFPDQVPEVMNATVTDLDASGSEVAFGLWRCGLITAAWEEQRLGDLETSRALVAQTGQASDEQLPGNAYMTEEALRLTDEGLLEVPLAGCQGWLGE